MKKMILNYTLTIATCLASFYVVYQLLLQDNILPVSISSIIAHAHGLEVKKHLLVLAILPFYIAAVIFGTAMLSIYLSSLAQQYLNRLKINRSKNKPVAEKLIA
jgi:hypothetical protein